MGRPAKTPAEHWLNGTKSQSKSATESVFTGSRPKFPKHLTGRARSEAKRVCKLLETRRTLTEGDIATIVLYAEVSVRWIETKEQVAAEGLMILTKMKNSNGELIDVRRVNPLLKIMQVDEAKLLTLSKELGLTPATRDRVRQTKEKAGGIPARVASMFPELLGRSGAPLEFKPPEPISATDMEIVNEETE